MEAATEIALAELLERVRRAGHAVTAEQVRRWQQAGLVPGPRQVSRGRGNGRGTVAVYPAAALAQLIALAELRRKHHELRDLAWSLWWCGFPVERCRWESVLFRAAATWDEVVAVLRVSGLADVSGILPDATVDALERAVEFRTDSKIFRRARKRVGSRRAPSLVRMLGELALGVLPNGAERGEAEEREEQVILVRGVGLEGVDREDVFGAGPLLRGDPYAPLSWVSGMLRGWSARAELVGAADTDLRAARDDVRLLLGLAAELAQATVPDRGRRRTPRSLTAAPMLLGSAGPVDQALLLLLYLRIARDPVTSASIGAIREAIRCR